MTDVEIDGEIYQCLDTEVFIPKMTSKNTKLLIQLQGWHERHPLHNYEHFDWKKGEPSTLVILRHALKRAGIESFHWDIKNVLGFEDYRFRESDAAIIHSHLVFLAYSLLLILNKRMDKKEQLTNNHHHHQNNKHRRSIG